ncbi:MAG TPA: hypothetical protein VGE34_03400 [Candidatus Saccharimonadales bacterium]
MSISRDRFDSINNKWGDFASWAIWSPVLPGDRPKANIGDLSVLNPDTNSTLLRILNPNVAMLGLNAATRPIAGKLSNFHDSYARGNDFKIRYAFQDTPYWGAYMTDVFKGLHETDSQKVLSYARDNPKEILKQINQLRDELKDLHTEDPLLIAFGDQAYAAVQAHLGDSYRVVKVMHYAHQIGKEAYRENVLEAINEYLNS